MSADHNEIDQEIVKCSYMLNATQFALVNGFPTLVASPLQHSTAGRMNFYDRSSALHLLSSALSQRIAALEQSPPPKFSIADAGELETAAHSIRCLGEFEKAYSVYESACLTFRFAGVDSIISAVRKMKNTVIVHTTHPDFEKCSQETRRVISHSFAGMAVCVLMMAKDGSYTRFLALASSAVIFEPSHPLELMGVLRVLLLLVGQHKLGLKNLKGVGVEFSSVAALFDALPGVMELPTVYGKFNSMIMVPLVLRLGRGVEREKELIPPGEWDSILRTATAYNQRCIDRASGAIPSRAAGPCVSIHIVDGQFVERTCAGCGEWDRVGNVFKRCKGCMAAYYCGRVCQLAHWPEHKKVCGGKK